MPVRAYVTVWLDGVEQALVKLIVTFVNVAVLSPAWTALR